MSSILFGGLVVSISFSGHRYLSDCLFWDSKDYDGLFEKTHDFSREKNHQQFQGTIISMPLKINMEQHSGGLVQILILSFHG